MLKRKLVKAGFFANGLLLILVVNGANTQPPADDPTKIVIDPSIRQLQAFDSSFIYLNEFPDSVLANAPKIRLNRYAIEFVKDHNLKNKLSLGKIKERSLPYFTIIDSIFSNHHLPVELKYLAVVESELKPKAVSRVGAVGPWQLMPSTARILSLKVTKKNDERTHYYKSTAAAAVYLKDLYHEFGDWLLVIAAYNCGPGRVEYAIKNSGSRNFWKLQNYLPAETRGHVKKFIATHYIMEAGNGDSPAGNFDYKSINGVSTLKPDISEEEISGSDKMSLSGKYISSVVAKNLGMELKDFNRYNPGFDNALASSGNYDLRLPNDKMDLFVANKYPILNECVQQLLGDVNVDTKTVYKNRNVTGKGK